jgi:DNA polymerase-3 subunit delta
VLVLWNLIEEIRLLNRLKQAVQRGENLLGLMKANRIWGHREKIIPSALQRLSLDRLEKALIFVSGLDRLAKGLSMGKHSGPLLEKMPNDPWQGLRMLGRLFI